MAAPRLEINHQKIEKNARVLVQRLGASGISVTGITKAALGNDLIAGAMLRGGVSALGDSRLANIKRLSGSACPRWLIRSPMMSEVGEVVASAHLSCNTELDVIDALSTAASKRNLVHQVVLMIELGDRREGIMPADLHQFIRQMRRMPAIALQGIGVNLACVSGVAPDQRNMGELSAIADTVEDTFALTLEIISGGNSANLDWVAGTGGVHRINNLRLGESILLGVEALHRQPVPGLHTDAFTLVAEVIESKQKCARPQGTIGQTALATSGLVKRGSAVGVSDEAKIPRNRAILALGAQDVDPNGLIAPTGITVVGASSDHVVIDTGNQALRVGSEVSFNLDYSALMRAMTSPFVALVPKPVGRPIANHRSLECQTLQRIA